MIYIRIWINDYYGKKNVITVHYFPRVHPIFKLRVVNPDIVETHILNF